MSSWVRPKLEKRQTISIFSFISFLIYLFFLFFIFKFNPLSKLKSRSKNFPSEIPFFIFSPPKHDTLRTLLDPTNQNLTIFLTVMEARRASRAVIDPKVRKVGFFAPPERSQSGPPDPISFTVAPSANSLSPVMIPPPRHSSENLGLHARPAPASPSGEESVAAGSYSSSSEFFPAPMSPAPSSYSSRIVAGDGVLFDGAAVASSDPCGGFDLTAVKASSVPASELTTASVVNAASLAIRGEVLLLLICSVIWIIWIGESMCFGLELR